MESDQRLIVVSNRLPVTLRRQAEQWKVTASSGGLSPAVSAGFEITSAAAGQVGFVQEPTDAVAD